MDAKRLGLVAALMFAAYAGAGSAQAPAGRPAAPPPAVAAPMPGEDRIVSRRGESAALGERSGEMAFVAGERVGITDQVADDIFASGGELRVEGAGADHLFLAGGEIDAAPGAVRDLIAAGGRILLRAGVVSDDVVAAGGEITLDRAARVQGSTVLAGGRLRVEAPVGRELMASGGRVELNGPVGGDARIRGREIVIGPQARIGGDLQVRGERIEISPAAVVQGRTVREVVERDRGAALRLGLAFALFALGVLVMLGVVAAAAPRLMAAVDRRLRSRLAVTLGSGALIVILTPVAVIALMTTVLGAPLGMLLALAYLLAIPLAFAGVAYWIGQFLRGRLARGGAAEPPRWPARFGWTALAGLLLMIACAIPFVGWLVWLAALAAGMGALATQAVAAASETPPGQAEAAAR